MPPSNQKPDKSRVESAVTRGSAGQAPNSAAPSPSGCEGALARVIQRARVWAEGESAAPRASSSRSRQPSAAGAPDASNADAREQLALTLRELDAETAHKIRVLMVAGKDGHITGGVAASASQPGADIDFASMVADSGESGAQLAEYLLRGHAIACAIGIDLDRPLAEWQSKSSDDLDERAWLSFGKQLASSAPEEWQCLAIVEPGTQGLSKLYLKLGDRAWWSFQAQLDRPTLAGVEKERRALARRRLKGIPSNTLEAVVGRLGSVQGRALRRASRAICARVGQLSAAG
jgi:hypothetical protein